MGNRLKTLREKVTEFENKIEAINAACDADERSRTEDEAKVWALAETEIEKLEREIKEAEAFEARQAAKAKEINAAKKVAAAVAGDTASRSDEREIEKLKDQYNFREAFDCIVKGTQPKEGIIREMHEEAINEKRAFGAGIVGLGIPAKMVEVRATVDQTNSAIQPTVVGGYVEGLRENSLAMKAGVRVLNGLTADYKIPIVGANSVSWATSENSAASDGGAQFTSTTLNPTRVTGYVDISNRLLLQNGDDPLREVMKDLGAATSELIDAAMFSTASVTNAPGSIAATSGVGTFTEIPTWVVAQSVVRDMLVAEQTALGNKANLNGASYIAATNLLYDIKQSPLVSGVSSAAPDAKFGMAIVNGYPCYFSTAATKSAGVSGDFLFGNFGSVYLGLFGGIDLIRDPYSALLNDETRVVLHRHLDFAAPRGAQFVKATSLIA